MLILTRRVGETVMIGDEVTVTVLRVKGNQVRLGVNAPKTISVQREEIFQRIKREKVPNLRSAEAAAVTELRTATACGRTSFAPVAPLQYHCAAQPACARIALQRERWPSGRRRTPAKGVRVKSPSRVRIPLSPPCFLSGFHA